MINVLEKIPKKSCEKGPAFVEVVPLRKIAMSVISPLSHNDLTGIFLDSGVGGS